MEKPNRDHGVWEYQCIICKQFFSSSQAIAGHTRVHYKDGWVKGTHQRKVFVPFSDYQQHQGSTIDSTIHQQQQISTTIVSDTDAPKTIQLASSPEQTPPKNNLRLRDMKTIARLRGRLTKEEERVILLLLDSAKK